MASLVEDFHGSTGVLPACSLQLRGSVSAELKALYVTYSYTDATAYSVGFSVTPEESIGRSLSFKNGMPYRSISYIYGCIMVTV